ncbi:hypothetical protein [Bacillus sp. P14.5]|uniref:hypothetical protein n=1 Tax=Bacillus sp. P14.5 TaxID=1983400 RepID=UPI000DEBF435|nr:hypothetical protein [Bacillus sp. P14.5]
MKKWIIIAVIVLVILLGIMYATKPSQERYNAWLIETISNRMEGESSMMSLGISLFGEQLIENNTETNDYIIFNTYETKFQGKELKFIGMFNIFIPLPA